MKQLHDGEWTEPVMQGYVIECCECGLRHVVDFKLEFAGAEVVLKFRARRMRKKACRVRRKR